MRKTDDLRIKALKPLVSPAILMEELAATDEVIETVASAREQAEKIIKGEDNRLLVIVGPCSIHDPDSALDYAHKLQKAAITFKKHLHIIMRVYFEKPRTTVGWKGFINDPYRDDSFKINKGLHFARKLLLQINELGLPTGTEFLDTINPQFIADLVSWGAIGARTTESQVHRELASGLSMPVGFKNSTSGNIQIAVDAIRAAAHSHHFLSVTKQGIAAIVATHGNDCCHLILRGGKSGPNYDAVHVQEAVNLLEKAHLTPRLMIDCSHDNSNKDHTQQSRVAENVAQQITQGSTAICGVMLESHLIAGRQDYATDKPLTYGQSITDACMGWDDTLGTLQQLADAVKVA